MNFHEHILKYNLFIVDWASQKCYNLCAVDFVEFIRVLSYMKCVY